MAYIVDSMTYQKKSLKLAHRRSKNVKCSKLCSHIKCVNYFGGVRNNIATTR